MELTYDLSVAVVRRNFNVEESKLGVLPVFLLLAPMLCLVI